MWSTLAVVVSGVVLVSSAPLPGPRLVEVATLDASTIVSTRVAGTRLFVVVPGAIPQLMAVRLADGGRLWQSPVAGDLGMVAIDVVGDTVLVSAVDPLARGPRTQALDVDTGRELWRSDLPRLTGVGVPGLVLVAAPLDKDGRPDPSLQGARLDASAPLPLLVRALDARTGRPVWSYQVPAGWRTVLGYDPSGGDPVDLFVVVAPGGRASAVDLASGRVRAAATTPLDPASAADGNHPEQRLALIGDQLLVGYLRQGQPTVTVYRARTLTPQWTGRVATLDLDGTRCPPLLCLHDRYGVRAVVPTTGVVVWTANGAAWFGLVDRWLYDEPQPFQPGSARLIDPATTHTVLDLGRWRLAAQNPGQPPLFELVEESGRSWLGLLAPGPRIQALGAVTDLPQNTCDVGTGYLACMTTAHQLRIWHYRP